MRLSKDQLRGPFKGRLRDRFKHRKKNPSVVPNMITLFAICSGLSGVRMAMLGKWDWAVMAIMLAGFLDFMDGRVARLLNSTSRFGAELDSLSDLVNFGVAPALILYIKTMHQWEELGWSVSLFFTVCMAIRLARFNVGNTPGASLYFTGVPAPVAGLLGLSPLIWSLAFPGVPVLQTPLVSAIVMIIVGGLMVSRLPTFSSKQIKIPSSYFVLALVGSFGLGVLLYTCPWLTLTCLGFGYVLTIPVSLWTARRMSPGIRI